MDDAAVPTGPALLQRVLLPRAEDAGAVRALYLEAGSAGESSARTALALPAAGRASFATYFNAFPAGYWQRWTVLGSVVLRLQLRGPGRVEVYRSTAAGVAEPVRAVVLDGAGPHGVHVELELASFTEGGWYWFTLTAGPDRLAVDSAGWYAPGPAPGRAAVTIGMPTFNRPGDCVATLAAIGADDLVRDAVVAVVVPDQGVAKVRDQDGFAEAAAALGERLRVIDQPNLGGSGGYARIMYEALGGTDCEQILFMDDDIVLEPDSVLRAVAFSRFAREPMLVGGQMLKLPERSEPHAMGEVVDRGIFLWQQAPGTAVDHDLAEKPLRSTPWLHRRIDVDYNAWWMCLIPRVVAQDVGLPLPLFIKWDDCEYGLRAATTGYPTATVPGVAVWHMSFADKDDNSDWQAYFLARNRLVVAALHAGSARPWGLLADSLRRVLGRLLLLEYSTAALQARALRDFLAGPQALLDALPTALGEVRALRARFTDGRPLAEPPAGTPPRRRAVVKPRGLLPLAAAVTRTLVHNLRAVDSPGRPQLHLRVRDARWYALSGADTVVVSSSDGSGVVLRQRDRQMFCSMLAAALRQHAALAVAFPRIARRYRAALGDLTGADGWKRVFEL